MPSSKLVKFHFDGQAYVVDAADPAWGVLRDGDPVVPRIRALLGEPQWERFRAKPRTVQDLSALIVVAQTAVGARLGRPGARQLADRMRNIPRHRH